MKEVDLEFRKQYSNGLHKAEKAAKPAFCLVCGKEKSLCNSHIVPRFILKEIDEKGMVCYSHSLVNYLDNIIDSKKGINNAFNFYLICRDCDKALFANYEDQNSILKFEDLDHNKQRLVLIEMALKTHFAHIFHKQKNCCLNSMLYPEGSSQRFYLKSACDFDVEEHRQYLLDLLCARECTSFDFEVLYNKLLDYEVGMATQTIIAYMFDLQGKQLFDPHNFVTTLLSKYFYLMILPINGKTRVLFYIEKKNVPFVKSIIEQFNALTEEEKLHFIFISLIVYDEQFYINPVLQKTIKKDKKLCKLFIQADANRGSGRGCKKIKNFRKYNNYLLNKAFQGQN